MPGHYRWPQPWSLATDIVDRLQLVSPAHIPPSDIPTWHSLLVSRFPLTKIVVAACRPEDNATALISPAWDGQRWSLITVTTALSLGSPLHFLADTDQSVILRRARIILFQPELYSYIIVARSATLHSHSPPHCISFQRFSIIHKPKNAIK